MHQKLIIVEFLLHVVLVVYLGIGKLCKLACDKLHNFYHTLICVLPACINLVVGETFVIYIE